MFVPLPLTMVNYFTSCRILGESLANEEDLPALARTSRKYYFAIWLPGYLELLPKTSRYNVNHGYFIGNQPTHNDLRGREYPVTASCRPGGAASGRGDLLPTPLSKPIPIIRPSSLPLLKTAQPKSRYRCASLGPFPGGPTVRMLPTIRAECEKVERFDVLSTKRLTLGSDISEPIRQHRSPTRRRYAGRIREYLNDREQVMTDIAGRPGNVKHRTSFRNRKVLRRKALFVRELEAIVLNPTSRGQNSGQAEKNEKPGTESGRLKLPVILQATASVTDSTASSLHLTSISGIVGARAALKSTIRRARGAVARRRIRRAKANAPIVELGSPRSQYCQRIANARLHPHSRVHERIVYAPLPSRVVLDLRGLPASVLETYFKILDLPEVRRIDIRDTKLDTKVLDEAIRGMKPQTLEELNLGGQSITYGIARTLKRHFAGSALTSLSLPHCRLGDTAAELTITLLKKSMKHLDLSRNKLTNVFALALGGAIKAPKCVLEHLNISWNSISGRGFLDLCSGIFYSSTLLSLNVSHCAIGAGTVKISEVIHNEGRESALLTRMTYHGDDPLHFFIEYLKEKRCRLIYVDFTQCRLNKTSCSNLKDALLDSRTRTICSVHFHKGNDCQDLFGSGKLKGKKKRHLNVPGGAATGSSHNSDLLGFCRTVGIKGIHNYRTWKIQPCFVRGRFRRVRFTFGKASLTEKLHQNDEVRLIFCSGTQKPPDQRHKEKASPVGLLMDYDSSSRSREIVTLVPRTTVAYKFHVRHIAYLDSDSGVKSRSKSPSRRRRPRHTRSILNVREYIIVAKDHPMNEEATANLLLGAEPEMSSLSDHTVTVLAENRAESMQVGTEYYPGWWQSIFPSVPSFSSPNNFFHNLSTRHLTLERAFQSDFNHMAIMIPPAQRSEVKRVLQKHYIDIYHTFKRTLAAPLNVSLNMSDPSASLTAMCWTQWSNLFAKADIFADTYLPNASMSKEIFYYCRGLAFPISNKSHKIKHSQSHNDSQQKKNKKLGGEFQSNTPKHFLMRHHFLEGLVRIAIQRHHIIKAEMLVKQDKENKSGGPLAIGTSFGTAADAQRPTDNFDSVPCSDAANVDFHEDSQSKGLSPQKVKSLSLVDALRLVKTDDLELTDRCVITIQRVYRAACARASYGKRKERIAIARGLQAPDNIAETLEHLLVSHVLRHGGGSAVDRTTVRQRCLHEEGIIKTVKKHSKVLLKFYQKIWQGCAASRPKGSSNNPDGVNYPTFHASMEGIGALKPWLLLETELRLGFVSMAPIAIDESHSDRHRTLTFPNFVEAIIAAALLSAKRKNASLDKHIVRLFEHIALRSKPSNLEAPGLGSRA